MNISIELRKIPDLAIISKAFKISLKELSSNVLEEIKNKVPVNTGRLKSSFVLTLNENNDNITAKIESLPYALILEEGTKPYAIMANNAKVLHFKIDNKDVFAKSVIHPGIKRRAFIKSSIENTLPNFSNILAKNLEKVIGEHE